MKYADWTIGEFLERVGSTQLTPSGGAVAAIGGALGAALCEMVCAHTDDEPLAESAAQVATCRERLLDLADEDAAAVRTFQDAQTAVDTGTVDAEQEPRTARQRLLDVPVRIAETCLVVVEWTTRVLADANPRTVADGVTGALLAHAALQAAVHTARTNSDGNEATRDRLATIEADAAAALQEINRRW